MKNMGEFREKSKGNYIIKGIFVIISIIALIVFIIVESRKNYKEYSKRVDNRRKAFKEAGLSEKEGSKVEEKLLSQNENDRIDRDINLPRELFKIIRFEEDSLPLSLVEIDKIDNVNYPAVHINQYFDRNKKRNMLNFLFQVPMSALLSKSDEKNTRRFTDGNTSVKNFVDAILGIRNREGVHVVDGFSETMRQIVIDNEYNQNSNIVFKAERYMGTSYLPYMYVRYEEYNPETDKWVTKTKLSPLPRMENPYNQNHTKGCELVWDIETEYTKSGSTELMHLPSEDETKYRNLRVEDVIFVVRVTFNVQDAWNPDGINKTSALKIIKGIYSDLVIKGETGTFRYDKIYFYVPDSDDESVYCERVEDGEETGEISRIILYEDDL